MLVSKLWVDHSAILNLALRSSEFSWLVIKVRMGDRLTERLISLKKVVNTFRRVGV